ncbi:MAG: hypothetical protein R3B96_15435 [Pirellulaceae bacterium]
MAIRRMATHVIVATPLGDTVLSVSEIRRLRSPALKTDVERTTAVRRNTKQWALQFDRPNAEVEVRLIYFRSGIRWIPTYRVALTDDTSEAVLSLQAEILNEAEDLEETAIDLVVGVPNFRFRNTPSPLSLEAEMRHTLAQAAPQMFNNGFANNRSQVMLSQRGGEMDRGAIVNNDTLPEVPAELNGAGTQDLYVIHLDPQEIARGARSVIPISRQTVPCRHIYSWNISVTRADVETAPTQSGAASPLKLTTNEVWHYLELTNNSDVPWTTGAAMILEGAQPLAQELLTYTPRGGKVRVPVTVAVDLRGAYEESETGRELRALNWDGYDYAKIAKQGEILLANRKREAIDFEIICHVPGTVTEAGAEGVVQLMPFNGADWENYRGSVAINQHSVVRWQGTIEPGEEFEAKVDSYYYARH